MRDADGQLKVMYRGDDGDFTVFDRKKSKSSNLYGRGFYFTDSESHAGQYGKAKEFYLNIEHPVSTTDTPITRDQMRAFLEAVAANEDDYSFENYGQNATYDVPLSYHIPRGRSIGTGHVPQGHRAEAFGSEDNGLLKAAGLGQGGRVPQAEQNGVHAVAVAGKADAAPGLFDGPQQI